MIELNLKCECGESTTVSEASAGAQLQCRCGRPIQVPALHELRKLAGLTLVPETIPETIHRKVNSGEIPSSRSCANCQMNTPRTINVSAICEQSWSKESPKDVGIVGSIWFYLKCLVLGLGAIFLYAAKRASRNPDVEMEHHGRDVSVTLPLPLCESCSSVIPSAWEWLAWPRNSLLIAGVTCALLFWYVWGIAFLTAGVAIGITDSFSRVSRKRKLRSLVASETEYEDLLSKYPNLELRIP